MFLCFSDILSHEGLAVIQDQLLPSYIRLNKFLNKVCCILFKDVAKLTSLTQAKIQFSVVHVIHFAFSRFSCAFNLF